MQCVGKTVNDFRLRWNNYKDNNRKYRKESCTQQHLFEHFSSECHSSFLDDVSIIFIDKTDSKDPNKQEHHWRYTLKTMARQWLNIDSFSFVLLIYPILFIAITACNRANQFGYSGLSMNILRTWDKSPVQGDFFRK